MTVHFVSITSQGVITVLNHLSGSELDQARTECAPSIRTLVDAVLPEVIGAKLTRVNEGISKYIHQRRELFALIQKTAEASAQQEAQLQEQAAQLSRLQSLVALPEEREPERKQEATVEPANVEMKERLTARTEEQLDFQRDICEELIYAWQDADESTREALIRVMINNGLEPVEEVGQEVGFNGNRHITSSPIDVGAIAVGAASGWRSKTRGGEYLIARARVQPKQSAHQEKLENVRND